MTDNFFDQAEVLFKPIAELASLNQAALETLAGRQTDLLRGLWNDGVEFAQKIMAEKEGNYLGLHQGYWESVNQRVTEATQSSVDILASTQAKLSDIFQATDLNKTFTEAVKPATQSVAAAESSVAKAVKVAAEPLTAAMAKVKVPAEPAKPKLPTKGGKKLGAEKKSVEQAIHSIVSEGS